MPSVSHSEVESYLTCRRKHYYGYTLGLKRKQEGAGLAFGTAGHSILEAFYSAILEAGDTRAKQKKAFDTAVSAAQARYDELVAGGWDDEFTGKIDLHRLIFEFYLPNEPFVKQGWLVQAVEAEFNLEYDSENQLRLPFVVDLIAVSPGGFTTIVDHKFLGQFYNTADTDIQGQIPKYIGALRALGHKVHEGMYNMLKTYDYKNPPKPEQVLMQLPVKPNGQRVQQTFIEQIGVSEEIQGLKQMDPEDLDARSYRVADKRVCQGCSFRDLCTSELSGGNTKLLIASEFEVRTRRTFVEVSEELDEDDE